MNEKKDILEKKKVRAFAAHVCKFWPHFNGIFAQPIDSFQFAHTHRTTCKKVTQQKRVTKFIGHLESAFVQRTDILIAIRAVHFLNWWIYLQITLLCGTYDTHTHTHQTHDFRIKNNRKKTTISWCRRNFSCWFMFNYSTRNTQRHSERSNLHEKVFPLHLIYANWNEKKRSNQVGNIIRVFWAFNYLHFLVENFRLCNCRKHIKSGTIALTAVYHVQTD